jgi:hypothetical protein
MSVELEVDELPEVKEAAGAAVGRWLVVLAAVEPGAGFVEDLRARGLREGAAVLVVAPALTTALGRWTDEERWHERAEGIMRKTVERLSAAGYRTRGLVGDGNPLEALDDALRTEPVSEVIAVDAPRGGEWLQPGLGASGILCMHDP